MGVGQRYASIAAASTRNTFAFAIAVFGRPWMVGRLNPALAAAAGVSGPN
jgi:hypothetical protein